ncbi:MAG: BatA domain-containing protein [Tepidisphaeraceae bacterium]
MFENPLMLAGLGGAVVPLVIHLLGRARYRTVEWGAMMFLDAATPPWRDGARLREYALLVVRMTAVGLLAVALARPIAGTAATGSAAALAPAESRLAVAIVIDCSASMAYQGVGPSRMESAKSAALQVLGTLRRGDRVVLIPAGAPAAMSPPPQLTGDLQAVAARVAELKPTASSADMADALGVAVEVLGRQERAARQLYVICDQQAESWRRVDNAFIAAWKPSRQTLSKFVVIPIGGLEVDNAAVELITPINLPAVRGCVVQVEVRVRNFSPEARVGLPLTLRAAGAEPVAATVNLRPLDTSTITLPITFAQAGSAVLTAQINTGAQQPDDTCEIVVEVFEPLSTLIVRATAGDAMARSSDPLAAALAPFRSAGRDGPDLATIEIVAADRWDAKNLSKYQLIVLDNVAQVSSEQADALEQFVYAGGGLLLAPGAASRTEEYNRVLYRDEIGLLPALLQPPVFPPAPLAIETSTIELASPLMRFLPGGTAQSVPLTAGVERFFPLTGRTPAAHVLAAFTSGDAFLVEQPFGRGRVALVTCSLGREWSTLPLTSLYLPLLQSTARFLVGGTTPARNFAAGEEVVATIAPAVDAKRGSVIRPDNRGDECDITSAEGRSELRYARTDLPGLYTIRVGPRPSERRVVFSVAPPPDESDLSPLARSHWDLLAARLDFERMESGARRLATRLGDARGGGEYWLVALLGVLGLLVIEMTLTRRWSASGGAGV